MVQRKHLRFPPFCQLNIYLSCLVSCQQEMHGSVPSTGHKYLCLVDEMRPSLDQQDGGPSPIDGREMALSRQQEGYIHGGRSNCSAVGSCLYVTCLSRQRDAFFLSHPFTCLSVPLTGRGTKFLLKKELLLVFRCHTKWKCRTPVCRNRSTTLQQVCGSCTCVRRRACCTVVLLY